MNQHLLRVDSYNQIITLRVNFYIHQIKVYLTYTICVD